MSGIIEKITSKVKKFGLGFQYCEISKLSFIITSYKKIPMWVIINFDVSLASLPLL
jgi:hypothetical protein